VFPISEFRGYQKHSHPSSLFDAQQAVKRGTTGSGDHRRIDTRIGGIGKYFGYCQRLKSSAKSINMVLFQSKNQDYYKRGETKRRSIVKAITWRTLGTLDTIVIAYVLTGEITTAVSIGGIEVFTKMFLYFFHERIWNTITWGKRGMQESEHHGLIENPEKDKK